jgi:hypothetical protein
MTSLSAARPGASASTSRIFIAFSACNHTCPTHATSLCPMHQVGLISC